MDENTMKRLLMSAQNKLREQGQLLQRLTETPLVYATVITTGSETKSLEEFAVGTKVQTRDSKRIGKITHQEGTEYIRVQFEGDSFSDWIMR